MSASTDLRRNDLGSAAAAVAEYRDHAKAGVGGARLLVAKSRSEHQASSIEDLQQRARALI